MTIYGFRVKFNEYHLRINIQTIDEIWKEDDVLSSIILKHILTNKEYQLIGYLAVNIARN